jgi:hypothetical protein
VGLLLTLNYSLINVHGRCMGVKHLKQNFPDTEVPRSIDNFVISIRKKTLNRVFFFMKVTYYK